ncbi:MAG TPA: tetratricopeptide repeat protein [Vicinamibacterales bacterium]|nr:tetratricopeptide repeat protein [Vicinamibacterales bacterium]
MPCPTVAPARAHPSRRPAVAATCALAFSIGALVIGWIALGTEATRVHAQRAPVTFTNNIAPILFTACVSCHRPEGAAPFSLLTYADAKAHAGAIVAATRDRLMPPWKPEPGYGEFLDERRLTVDEIRMLAQWLEDGLIEGDVARLPAPPSSKGPWQLGTPDLVIETAPYALRASSEDVYRNFVLPIEMPATRYIRAWEFLPGSGAVHHATMHFDPTRASRRLDEQDPEPGYEGLVPHSAMSPDGYFLGWLPGLTSNVAPPGMAWPLPAGADAIMMLHLKPGSRPETIRPRLGLYFSDAPPRLQPTLIRMTRQHIDIPPGERRYVVTDSFPLEVDADLYTIQPHAHLLANEVKSYATLPDGTRKWLIYIRNWNFNWQGVFRYARPQFLPAGTTIAFEFTYDNSAANPRNPHHPPRRVSYGQHTTDEMAELWLQVVTRNPADRARLARTARERIVREDIVGTERRLDTDPDNATLHDDVALLHAEAGHLDRTVEHFAHTVRVRPDSTAAHYNLGNALFRLGRGSEAIASLRKALTLQPDYALAHDGLGVALHAEGRIADALEHYRRAVALDPSNREARHHLAVALRQLGRVREADQVIRVDP